MSIDLLAAGAANHQSMFAAQARARGGRTEPRYSGIFAYGDSQDAQVGFPCVPSEHESAFADEVISMARQRHNVPQIGWWLLDESRTSSLGPKLLARGFSWGWRPNWMALPVEELIESHPVPTDIDIVPEPDGFAAIRGGSKVGGIECHVCTFEGEPVGGIYATVVEEQQRRAGIGTALTVAASRELRLQGCRHVLLNATPMGQPVYLRAGFELIGESGQTWWMPGKRLAQLPSDCDIAFVEAIGTGALAAAEDTLPRDLDAELACGETALAIAAITKQAASARWLIEHGATRGVVTG